MLVVGEHAGSHIAGFSNQFQSEFVSLLSRRRVYLQFCFLLLFSPLLICIIVLIYICIGLERSVCEPTVPTRFIKNISLTNPISIELYSLGYFDGVCETFREVRYRQSR